jgi:hypothetical protein
MAAHREDTAYRSRLSQGRPWESSRFVVESKTRVRPTFLRNEQGATDSASVTRKQTVHAARREIVFRASFLLDHRPTDKTRIVVESRAGVRPMFPRNEQGVADFTKASGKQTVHDGRAAELVFCACSLMCRAMHRRLLLIQQAAVRPTFPGNEQGVADSTKASGKQTVHDGRAAELLFACSRSVMCRPMHRGMLLIHQAAVRPTFPGNEQGASDSESAAGKQTVHAARRGAISSAAPSRDFPHPWRRTPPRSRSDARS